MSLNKNDFIEIDFTARIKDGPIFDSTKKEELEKIGFKKETKPFIFALNQGMFLNSIDEFLENKEIGKYKISLAPEKAFGKRDPKQIQMIPLKFFKEHRLSPIPGNSFNFDGRIGKVLTLSGGRVLVDFNSPLSGKDVEYEIEIKRKVEDLKEQVDAVNDFFFRKKLDFELNENKVILLFEKQLKPLGELFKKKYEEILKKEIEIKEKAE